MLATQTFQLPPESVPQEGQLDFLRRRLREAAANWTGERLDDHELIADGVDGFFWELIGVRVQGHDSLLLGAVEFRHQSADRDYSRQSLPSYLAGDCPFNEQSTIGTPSLVAVELPLATESVSEFLRNLEGKRGRHHILFDKSLVQVLFDLRTKNPSRERLGCPTKSVRQTVVMRTRDGHVLSGNLLNLKMKLRRQLPFVAVTMGVQHTIHGNLPLPTLFLHRAYISMLSAADDASLEDQLSLVSFQPENANPLHLVVDV